jgi:hypothetical protein
MLNQDSVVVYFLFRNFTGMVEGTREPGIWCVTDYFSLGMLPICQMALEILALQVLWIISV